MQDIHQSLVKLLLVFLHRTSRSVWKPPKQSFQHIYGLFSNVFVAREEFLLSKHITMPVGLARTYHLLRSPLRIEREE